MDPNGNLSHESRSKKFIDTKIVEQIKKVCRKIVIANKQTRGPDIAQWIRLRLPFCCPGSSPKHTIYAFIFKMEFVLYLFHICHVKRGKINK